MSSETTHMVADSSTTSTPPLLLSGPAAGPLVTLYTLPSVPSSPPAQLNSLQSVPPRSPSALSSRSMFTNFLSGVHQQLDEHHEQLRLQWSALVEAHHEHQERHNSLHSQAHSAFTRLHDENTNLAQRTSYLYELLQQHMSNSRQHLEQHESSLKHLHEQFHLQETSV